MEMEIVIYTNEIVGIGNVITESWWHNGPTAYV